MAAIGFSHLRSGNVDRESRGYGFGSLKKRLVRLPSFHGVVRLFARIGPCFAYYRYWIYFRAFRLGRGGGGGGGGAGGFILLLIRLCRKLLY